LQEDAFRDLPDAIRVAVELGGEVLRRDVAGTHEPKAVGEIVEVVVARLVDRQHPVANESCELPELAAIDERQGDGRLAADLGVGIDERMQQAVGGLTAAEPAERFDRGEPRIASPLGRDDRTERLDHSAVRRLLGLPATTEGADRRAHVLAVAASGDDRDELISEVGVRELRERP